MHYNNRTLKFNTHWNTCTGVRTQAKCPAESCVPLRECPALACPLHARAPHSRANAERAICGSVGAYLKVCCPTNEATIRSLAEICEKRSMPMSSLLPETCGQHTGVPRIVGGREASLGQYPWMVALHYKRAVLCGGSLISGRYVLTAAHCVASSYLKKTHVVLGDWRLSTDPDCSDNVCAPERISVLVEEVVVHPGFNTPTVLNNDIALIRLRSEVNFNQYIQPICLPPTNFGRSEVSVNQTVLAVGWGHTRTGDGSDVLRVALLNIANPFVCKRVFPSNFHLNGVQMCIGGGPDDTCSGDSGGPVMNLNKEQRYYVLAVTSFGTQEGCGISGRPAVYTSVAHFNDWIRQSMKY
ncbi:putative serine protease [Hyalella azteca]|uniref:Putative serine protease n=1 Tax=Hyalella azteca TaxID=294128 RepID=A0A6A0GQ53_HYAAZ|nr:putative serine protease [Hyalella azteca]